MKRGAADKADDRDRRLLRARRNRPSCRATEQRYDLAPGLRCRCRRFDRSAVVDRKEALSATPPDAAQGWQRRFPSAGSMNSLLAHPDGDDAVAVLLQGHAAVVISVGAPMSTHGSALGVIAPREGIAATRQTQRCEQQQYPHV